jgi:hypothetical protein
MEHFSLLVVRCLRLIRTSNVRRGLAGIAIAIASALAVLGASFEACSVYDTSLLLPALPESSTPAEAATDPNACRHVGPPGRPDAGDADGGSLLEVIAAFKTIDIGLTADASAPRPPYGYDLDNVCTCPGPPSCVQEQGAPTTCDDDAGGNTGIDNTDIDLFRGLGGAASTGTAQIDDGLQAGQYGLLLAIDNYNGLADDANVTVSFYVSNGINRNPLDGGMTPPDFSSGNDLWTIDPNSLVVKPQDAGAVPSCAHLSGSTCQSIYSDDQAYVSDFVVVAHFNQLMVAFGDRSFLGGATMQLSSAIVVGKLDEVELPTGFSYELTSGTIAGRWPTKALLGTLATIPDTTMEGGFLCGEDKLDYDIIKRVVCQIADISQNPANDNMNAACDAVSVGMTFSAGPAQLGAVFAVPPAPAGCTTDAGFPFTDTCP